MANDRKSFTSENWDYMGKKLAKKNPDYLDDEERQRVERQKFINDINPSLQLYYQFAKEQNQKATKKRNKKAERAHLYQKGIMYDLSYIARPQANSFFFKMGSGDYVENKNKKVALYLDLPIVVLLQAVVDGGFQKVKELLDFNPQLLLVEPPKDLVIESTLTHRRFFAENVLKTAAKLNTFKMLELLLTYTNKLKQTEALTKAKDEALSSRALYEKTKNSLGQDEIIIPETYKKYAESLITLSISAASYEHIIAYENSQSSPDKHTIRKFEKELCETEFELNTLLNKLLPTTVTKLEDFDMDLFFLALTQSFRFNIDERKYRFERDINEDCAFKKRVFKYCTPRINFIQSALDSETVEAFCLGLHNVVAAIEMKQELKITQNAANLLLEDVREFYSTTHHSARIPKPQFAYGIFGLPVSSENMGGFGTKCNEAFEKLCLAKEAKFLELKQKHTIQRPQKEVTKYEPETYLRCVMF